MVQGTEPELSEALLQEPKEGRDEPKSQLELYPPSKQQRKAENTDFPN